MFVRNTWHTMAARRALWAWVLVTSCWATAAAWAAPLAGWQSSGTFVGYTGQSTAVVSGINSRHLVFGQPLPGYDASELFIPTVVNLGNRDIGTQAIAAQMMFYNGSAMVSGTPAQPVLTIPDTIDIAIHTTSCQILQGFNDCGYSPYDATVTATLFATLNLPTNSREANADGLCFNLQVTPGLPGTMRERCIWAYEDNMAVFAFMGVFGSLHLYDLVPLDANGFVTTGHDPTQNQTFFAPTAGSLPLVLVAALALYANGRRGRRAGLA